MRPTATPANNQPSFAHSKKFQTQKKEFVFREQIGLNKRAKHIYKLDEARKEKLFTKEA
uniref:Bm13374 n=1 Tax=Brugia malayi TaxID=6279 RepID=A0A1I9G087_BRUMA|nr:Bm13374 [Brugia malayi]